MARGIRTATILTTRAEWEKFKQVAEAKHRLEAGQLAALAEDAVLSGNFRLLERAAEGGPHQIKTEKASPFLVQLATQIERETGRKVTLSEIAESLVRSLSVQ